LGWTGDVCHEDVQMVIQLAIWYDRHERDDAKRERYVKLIGNALRSDDQIQDVSTFVQTIEQLNERDVIMLSQEKTGTHSLAGSILPRCVASSSNQR
jgi:hypothetical protein